MGGKGREVEEKEERGKEGKGGERREGGKVASWLLGDGRPWILKGFANHGGWDFVVRGDYRMIVEL